MGGVKERGGGGVGGRAGVSVKVPGIVLVDGAGVNGRSEESVSESALEGVTTCIGDDPEDVAGAFSWMDATLCCTGIKRTCRTRKISTLRLDGM